MGVSYKGFGDGGGSKIQGLVIYPPAAMAAKYNSPPNWNTAAGSLGAANGGVAYTFNLSASDPQNQVLTYTLQSGSLPTGLSLSSSGVISGTPTNIPGTSNFIVRVSDGEFYTDRTFSLDVTNQTPIWETAGGTLTSGTQGVAYTVTFVATDPNNDIVTYSVIGSLPDGLTLNSSTGELSGTPTVGNSFSFTIRATDALSAYVDRAFSVVISEQPDQYWNNVTLLMRMNGANNSTTFTDERGHTFTRNGNAVISTSTSKFGGASGYFNGSTSTYLSSSYSSDFNFGALDYTIEAWVKTTATNGEIVSSFAPNSPFGGWAFGVGSSTNNGVLNHYQGNGITVGSWSSGTIAVNDGQWHHVAVTRVGTTIRYFVDGVLDTTTTNTNNGATNTNVPIHIGADTNSPVLRLFNGNIDDLRITKGVARYTTNFTPPSYQFPAS